MKKLEDVVDATEARGAVTYIENAQGSPKLRGCLFVFAAPKSDPRKAMATILTDPDGIVDGDAFAHYVADLDDPKTWGSVGVEMPTKDGSVVREAAVPEELFPEPLYEADPDE